MDRHAFEHAFIDPVSRRRLLGVGLTAAGAALSRPGAPTRAMGTRPAEGRLLRPQFASNPFTLGVASGDPLPESIVLWTRLAPDPLNDGGMSGDPVEVRWEVATDEAFTKIVKKGVETATAEFAHSVHADATGLKPGAVYYYRFEAGGELSPVGRTKTAPAASEPLDRLRWASASCAHYEHGFFSAYRGIAAEEIDFVAFLGDYIYEYGANGSFQADDGPVRSFNTGETITLADYRNRYALYRTDPDLQAAHAALPWIVTWDDHEVENDYADDTSSEGEPTDQFLARRAAAYQAYYEHLPLRPDSLPSGPNARLYRRLTFGDLAELNVLDTRQYRTAHLCGGVGPHCDAMNDPSVTLTGPEQEQWLFDGLAKSPAIWNVIAQQVMMAQLDTNADPAVQRFNLDQWDGYPMARQRLFDHLVAANVRNPIVLAGDIHSAWASNLKLDFDDERSPTIGAEFVATSITSQNPYGRFLPFALPPNPHIKFVDARHGYTLTEATRNTLRTDFRAVASVATDDAPTDTIASFIVASGSPGLQKS